MAQIEPSPVSKEVIQRAIYAALGTVKPDYRSPKRIDEAASVIADFVIAALVDGQSVPEHERGGAA